MTQPARRQPRRLRPTPAPSSPPAAPARQWLTDARSALIAGVVAAVIGVGGVSLQVNAEDARSAAEFKREQQQASYAEFVASATSLQQAESVYIEGIEFGSSSTDLVNEQSAVADAYSDLSTAASNVALVGSSRAATLALQVDTLQIALVSGISVIEVNESYPDDIRAGLVSGMERRQEKIARIQDEFILQARTDLATSP